MAKRMALVPPELVSEYYQLTKPEIRLEDNILKVLQQNDMPDDLRAKLLSQLIPKYQRAMLPPPPPPPAPKPPELTEDLLGSLEHTKTPIEEESISERDQFLVKYLSHAVPKTFKKFTLAIIRKLRNVGYIFNDKGEIEEYEKPVYRSNVIDLFSYLMRDPKKYDPPPRGFDTFLRGIHHANVPITWIGNKRAREHLGFTEMDPLQQKGRSPKSPLSSDLQKGSTSSDLDSEKGSNPEQNWDEWKE
ncbi:hypothetical protein RF55_21265 [Lasius niger]|uniref:Uncharacterized protein n=1 Tax=Lasius niger TaxID=67767 RepID=A0A0J7JYL9_LASNI|nr:hypothetical protein RF55_21265 [Lasius niger]